MSYSPPIAPCLIQSVWKKSKVLHKILITAFVFFIEKLCLGRHCPTGFFRYSFVLLYIICKGMGSFYTRFSTVKWVFAFGHPFYNGILTAIRGSSSFNSFRLNLDFFATPFLQLRCVRYFSSLIRIGTKGVECTCEKRCLVFVFWNPRTKFWNASQKFTIIGIFLD